MSYLIKGMIEKSETLEINIKDSYGWHKRFWECFKTTKGDERPFQFRIKDDNNFFQILILSEKEFIVPSWGINWQCKKIPESFLENMYYRFEIKTNPTKRNIRNKKRIGIYKEEGLRTYIKNKAKKSGFVIKEDSLAFTEPFSEFFIKKGKKGKHNTVIFKGILKVIDKELFIKNFNTGIGTAKSFGYGMLMLQLISK